MTGTEQEQPKLPSVGEEGVVERTVDESLMTPAYGKPDIEVLASPALIGLMELAGIQVTERFLTGDYTSVGMSINFEHLRPSWKGARVRTVATVEKVLGRTVTLSVMSFEGDQTIARAKHVRAVTRRTRFDRAV